MLRNETPPCNGGVFACIRVAFRAVSLLRLRDAVNHVPTKGEEEESDTEPHDATVLLAPVLHGIGGLPEVGESNDDKEGGDEDEIIEQQQRHYPARKDVPAYCFGFTDHGKDRKIRCTGAGQLHEHDEDTDNTNKEETEERVHLLHRFDLVRVVSEPL